MRFPFGLIVVLIGWIISGILKQNEIRRKSQIRGMAENDPSGKVVWHKKNSSMDEFFARFDEKKEASSFGEAGKQKEKEPVRIVTEEKKAQPKVVEDQRIVDTSEASSIEISKKKTKNKDPIEQVVLQTRRKRSKLQKAIIYSEVIGKPKSLR
ncbi:MAG: hypothetical protein Q4A75_06215 [Peptostreptococcaceae bacterium]|nr:hypothetical protein [Peptostreptococcaceae bacterium]